MTVYSAGIFFNEFGTRVGVRREVRLQAVSHMAAAFSADIVRAVCPANPAADGCGIVTV